MVDLVAPFGPVLVFPDRPVARIDQETLRVAMAEAEDLGPGPGGVGERIPLGRPAVPVAERTTCC